MLTQTHLPIMETENFKSVYGSLKFSIQERKLSVVLGAPGSGKTTVLKMLESVNILVARNHESGNLEIGVPLLGNRLFCA